MLLMKICQCGTIAIEYFVPYFSSGILPRLAIFIFIKIRIFIFKKLPTPYQNQMVYHPLSVIYIRSK